MSRRDTRGLGYREVDDDENVAVRIDTMDATARWDATVELRAWERHHLRLTEGERLLDVGCGLGEAALALAEDLGATGEALLETEATQVWTTWDPDDSPDGCFSMRSLADDLVATGQLNEADADQFVSTVHDAARSDHCSMSLTMFAVLATTPAS